MAPIATAATPLTAAIRDDRMPPVRDGLGEQTTGTKSPFRVAQRTIRIRLWKKVNTDSIFMNCLSPVWRIFSDAVFQPRCGNFAPST